MTDPVIVQLPRAWRRGLIAIACSVLVTFMLSVVLAFYFAHQSYQRSLQNERQICGLIVTLDDVYRQTPPTTETGRNFADQLHTYRVALGC